MAAAAREVADDRADLLDTHAEFEAFAGRRFDAFRARGHALEKVLIEVADLVTWCRFEGRPIDGPARAAYAGTGAASAAARHCSCRNFTMSRQK
jgi:hypothetical protein